MYYVYILQSNKNGRYYIGSCVNVNKRLDQHNAGYTKSTKPFRPWKIVYTEEQQTLSESRKRELQIKSWKKREMIECLIKGL